ncbi:MAG: S8 family serine peptidase [Acidobacteriota bacterium]|nr:S8 family serine peptidase [Acidobacteriota bacterium]
MTIRLLSVLALSVVLGSQTLSTQAGIGIPAEVTAQVAADGSALVIIGVRAAFVPEGNLAGPAAVAAQRDAMHAAVDAAMGRAAAAGAIVGARFDTIPFFTARVDAGSLASLAAQNDIASIEIDALARATLAQSVPLVNAPAAWAAGFTGMGWNVAILDTGVDKAHGFLTGKVVQEACYSNGNGLGAGTTVCPGGVTASTAVGSGVPCSASISGCDHGTHVAGIAAGANGAGGMNGVAPGANLVAMQVFTRFDDAAACGGAPPCVASYTSDQIRALERVLALAGAANVNHVASANMSLGGGGPFTFPCDATEAARKAAIDNLAAIGIATAIATGNNGFTTGVSAPACISSAIAVGSSTKTDTISSFTNRGSGLVDLLAPGSAINSSVPGNVFSVFNGTSMATPHVAGTWAVLKQAAPTVGVAQMLGALQATGLPITDSTGQYRRINVNAARLALTGGGGGAPGAPGMPTISGAGNTVNISWTAPTTGGVPTLYTVLARLAPGGSVVASLPVGNMLGTSVAAPNGTFHVTVQASNASGPGPESAGVTFSVPIVVPPPGAPTNLAVTVAGNQATFTWTPPTTGGATTGYLLVAALSPGGPPIAALPFVPPTPAVTVQNIPPGTYFVRLAATNAGGAGPLSNEVVVNVAGPQPPGPPTMNPAVVSGGMVTLSWSAPTTGGAPTSYLVVASLTPGGPSIASLPVVGLGTTVPAPSGSYFVRVHGVNALGMGQASNEITVLVP